MIRDKNPWHEFLGTGGQVIAKVREDDQSWDNIKVEGRAVITREDGYFVVRTAPREVPKSVLQEADTIINGARQSDYGSPLQSHQRIAKFWSVILDHNVTAEEVALCMIGLKISRYLNGAQRDSLVDIAGYAGCIELMKKERDE